MTQIGYDPILSSRSNGNPYFDHLLKTHEWRCVIETFKTIMFTLFTAGALKNFNLVLEWSFDNV